MQKRFKENCTFIERLKFQEVELSSAKNLKIDFGKNISILGKLKILSSPFYFTSLSFLRLLCNMRIGCNNSYLNKALKLNMKRARSKSLFFIFKLIKKLSSK